jgi:hypothetical protein
LKRAPFLGATGAVLLSGCGGRHVMQALPGVAPSSTSSAPKLGTYTGRLVPEVAEAIPEAVLRNPIIGEARRFDGASAPTNWMVAQGQSLPVAGNRPLFSVLGTCAGGDGKTTFNLPNTKVRIIVAIGGTSVTSPSMLSQSGRHMTVQDSLGAGAVRAPFKLPKPPSPQILASQRLAQSSIRVGRPSPVPVTPELASRFRQAYSDARTAALAQLGPNSRARLDAAVDAAVAGRISVYGAVSEMISSLTSTESNALLRINDAMIQPFNDRAVRTESQNPQSDAAHYLISVAITREQIQAMYRITRGAER